MCAVYGRFLKFGFTLAAVAGLTAQVVQAIPPLGEYGCTHNTDCGSASKSCWGSGHVWGQEYCSFCAGSADGDFCQKQENTVCTPRPYGYLQQCGPKIKGTCMGGPIGSCSGAQQIDTKCDVIQCI